MTMPHMSSGGSEDFYSTDEVKVYKDEGNKDEEKRSSENLTEEKLGLVTESEEVSVGLPSNKCQAFDLFSPPPRSQSCRDFVCVCGSFLCVWFYVDVQLKYALVCACI